MRCPVVQTPNFDDATAALVDQQQCLSSPEGLVQLGGLLKLAIKAAKNACKEAL